MTSLTKRCETILETANWKLILKESESDIGNIYYICSTYNNNQYVKEFCENFIVANSFEEAKETAILRITKKLMQKIYALHELYTKLTE